MEALSAILKPYGDIIATAAAGFTYVQMLSGAVICNDIRKKGSTAGFPLLPFLAGVVLSVMIARFGVIMNDAAMVKVNLMGIAINLVYVCFYFMYTNNVKDKTLAFTQIGYAGAFIAAVFAYTLVENPEVLPSRYGLLLTAVLFYVVGAPLLGLGEIIRKKSTEGLPFPLIFTGTIISFLWLLHGIVILEYFTIVQNIVIFLMSVVQLSLFVIYPSTPAESPKKSKRDGTEKQNNNNGNNNKKKN